LTLSTPQKSTMIYHDIKYIIERNKEKIQNHEN